jgi:Arc/MetJ-type ribon-helix-helix transcriptional regulator
MHQAKFSLEDDQLEFLDRHRALGYPDKSTLVRAALDRLRRETEQERLRESAALYAEVYAEDAELQRLTDQASDEWPD